MRHLMLDLRTLGKVPGCGIAEIACISFAEEAEGTGFAILCDGRISLKQNLLSGLQVSKASIKWTMEDRFLGKVEDQAAHHQTMEQALAMFARDLDLFWYAHAKKGYTIWCKDPDFDIAILKEAYDSCGITRPIALRDENYRQWRSVRTFVNEFQRTMPLTMASVDTASYMAPSTDFRTCIEKCKKQASQVQQVYKAMKKTFAEASELYRVKPEIASLTRQRDLMKQDVENLFAQLEATKAKLVKHARSRKSKTKRR